MVLLGSLVIALKCTRPRQRFMYAIGRYSMREADSCQEEIILDYQIEWSSRIRLLPYQDIFLQINHILELALRQIFL